MQRHAKVPWVVLLTRRAASWRWPLPAAAATTTSTDKPPPSRAAPTRGRAAAETISVGMVSDTGGLDDRGFNEFSINGFERAQTELGVDGRVYTSESADDYLPNLTAAVDDGHDLVIAIGFLIQPSVVEVALRRPT